MSRTKAVDVALLNSYKEQLHFLNITAEDLRLMHSQRENFIKEADGVVKEFYEYLQRYAYLDNLIKKHSTVERLSKTQREYFISLTDEKIDDEYIAQRLAVGKKHQEIGLYPKWYLGAYHLHWAAIKRIVWQYNEGRELCLRLLEAFSKRIIFDMELAIESYIIEQLDKLNQFHEEIAAVASIISDIADQTKILSLNASIEAARAGEHGRSFAVVAQAVRDLAARTSKSAQDIAQKVKENSGILEKMRQS
ncbi:MAG: globin-coupled sensor protein [Thermoanaerobacteraceae bacterium]|nr:globin-coupled sensor protein [Thermoanaerobacteraceae bacterium]